MNTRPRCREWLPLSTQQLRLRNLQSIQGVNIKIKAGECSILFKDCVDPQIFLYYTLHAHPENFPFYQSEKVALRKHLNVKWAEIQCPEILKSNANCVCIKVWANTKKTELLDDIKNYSFKEEEKKNTYEDENILQKNEEPRKPLSALTLEFIKFQKLPMPSDALVLNWAVYFSGLISLSQNNDIKCCPNSLIFQMNNEYFASPELFSTESLRGQLAINFEKYSASVPKCSIPTPDEFTINSPQVSRSSSPISVDWQKDLLRMAKTRYILLNCVRSEVRPSYNLKKLLKLQELQRQHLQILRESLEMTADIKRLSVRCITKEQLLRKQRTSSFNSSASLCHSTAYQYHSMGRTLSRLLAEQQDIDPHQMLQAQHLQQQIESVKSKRRLLISVKETTTLRISQLRKQLSDAANLRQQTHSWLSTQLRKLNDDKQKLKYSMDDQIELRQRRYSVTRHVERIMSSLCLELKDIYPINRNRLELYTICGIPFPTIDGYIVNSLSSKSVNMSENISPMALSVSLGYVAHLIEMMAVVLNCPLRNPIVHEGSRTRIMDIIKNIPSFTSREFPLYSRSSIPTKPVKYAVNLLNQNIAQLCFDITGKHCDMRATIDNLLHIFATFALIEQGTQEMHIHKRPLASKHLAVNEIKNCDEIDDINHDDQQYHYNNQNNQKLNLPSQMSIKNGEEDNSLSKSHSSLDISQMIPPTTIMHHLNQKVPVFPLTDKFLRSHPIEFHDHTVLKATNLQRSCRSVGSYTDSEEEVCHSTPIRTFSSSESNLTSLQSIGHHNRI